MALASVALNAARTFLNDDAATLWTDAVLIPKLQQAHRELQNRLWLSGSPVMRKFTVDTIIGIGVLAFPAIADIVEPIALEERGDAEANSLYVPMTEYDPLPVLAQTATLRFWNWSEEVIKFLGSTSSRTVRVLYRKSITVPADGTVSLAFTSAELYIAPRTAAIAAGSTGNKDLYSALDAEASAQLDQVILSNRGKLSPQGGSRERP